MNPNLNNMGKNDPREPDPGLSRPESLPTLASRPAFPSHFEMGPVPAAPMIMPNAMTLLDALRRRCQLIFTLGPVLAGLIAFAVWYLIPPAKYTAKAVLHVESSAVKILFDLRENRVDFATYCRTQLALVKSRIVLNTALNNPKVRELEEVKAQVDPVLWLEKRLNAVFLGETLQISMTGEKPNDLAAIVNAVTKAYESEVVDGERKRRADRYEMLRGKNKEYLRLLEADRKMLKEKTERFGSKDKQTIRLTQELAIERQSEAKRDLHVVQRDLRNAKAEFDILLAHAKEGENSAATPEAAIQQFINADGDLRLLKQRMNKAQSAYANASRIAKNPSDDPAAKKCLMELTASTKAYKDQVEALRVAALDRFKASGPGEEGENLRELRIRIKILEEQEKVTQAMFDAQSEIVAAINHDSIYIDNINEEISQREYAVKEIGNELVKMDVEKEAPDRVKIYEDASTPRPEEDKRLPMAGIAGVGTFGLLLIGIALLEFRAQRISSIDEVNRVVGLRVVGALPVNREYAQKGREPSPYGGSLMAESIDSIRTMILHSTGERPLRSIMITSATSGEGKTSLSCHLAMSLARSGLKTLLIDCDLRKPTIHQLFDIPASPGFSEFLRGEVNAEEIVRPTAVDGLDAITAGSCDSRTLRALARADTGAIFDAFADSHDIIVVDTSPVLPVTDSLLVGRHVDGAVYSILRDVSRVPLTMSAVGRLKLMNIRLLGAVVTGVNSPLYGTYYSGYGGYGGAYGNQVADHGEVHHA